MQQQQTIEYLQQRLMWAIGLHTYLLHVARANERFLVGLCTGALQWVTTPFRPTVPVGPIHSDVRTRTHRRSRMHSGVFGR